MPLYEFKRDSKGIGYFEEVDLGYSGPKKDIGPPPSVDVDAPKTKLWKCTLCEDVAFKTAGLMANHFNQNHQDHREDQNSWRGHHEVIYESPSG